ncbi:MAG TPA: helicase-related protein, partial [Pirellulales bacterium]
VERLAGREIQRIGLSATVGNPDVLIDWLAGSAQRPRCVLHHPPASAAAPAEVKLDFVGSLSNAATVVSRLHRGEKRLVFLDSRARAEQLGAELRALDVAAFVTHSSLSQEQRQQTERAFADRSDCVIVATSVLELGVDVGDLDRVIQIDSPATVSSFLQRMGRTGRRVGTIRNCLFLATSHEALLQAASLIRLWESGYVEPIDPPPEPYHVLAQQLFALILQHRGVGKRDWLDSLGSVAAFQAVPRARIDSIVEHMLAADLLWEDGGMLGIGRAGERLYGRRNFMELMSVFLSPPQFKVLHGRQELGQVDDSTFHGGRDGPRVLSLGGRSWQVTHVDWSRKIAYVEPSDERGRSRWKGGAGGLRFDLCQSIKSVLVSDAEPAAWSQRTRKRLQEIRSEFAWLREGDTVVLTSGGGAEWWTFGGWQANAILAAGLSARLGVPVKPNDRSLVIDAASTDVLEQALTMLRCGAAELQFPVAEEHAKSLLKFADCLPHEILMSELQSRQRAGDAVEAISRLPHRFVSDS